MPTRRWPRKSRSRRPISTMAKPAPKPCRTIQARSSQTALTAVLNFVMRSGRRVASPGSSRPACGGRDEQETQRKLHEWNQPIHRVRGRIEKIFGTWKRSYGLRRMRWRWRGLAKAAVQVHLTAIAYNLKRTMKILATARAALRFPQGARSARPVLKFLRSN
jgi:IS5 family transposase